LSAVSVAECTLLSQFLKGMFVAKCQIWSEYNCATLSIMGDDEEWG